MDDPLSADLLHGFVSHIIESLPPMLKSAFHNDIDHFKGLYHLINELLADDAWSKLDHTMEYIFEVSPFLNNRAVMEELFSQVFIPQKHWTALQKRKLGHPKSILNVIDAITSYGTKESIVKCFSESGGIVVIQKFFDNRLCSEAEQILCLRILGDLLAVTANAEYAKLVVPVAEQFRDLIENNICGFKVMQLGVKLIYQVSLCPGSKELISGIFKSGVVSYAVKVLTKCQKAKEKPPLADVILWQWVCKTIAAVLKDQSANFNKGNVPILTLNMLKIIRKCVIDLKEHKDKKMYALEAAVLVLGLMFEKTISDHDLVEIKEYGVIKDVVNVLCNILEDDDLKNWSRGMVYNSYLIISWMICVEPNVRVIAPILPKVHKSLTKDSSEFTSSYAGVVAEFCYEAVKKGSPADVKYLKCNGLMPLLAKLREYLTCVSSLFQLVNALYDVILKVPETDEFSYFEKRLFYTLLYHFGSPIHCENGKAHKKEKDILAYAITAVGTSCMCTDDQRFKSLDDYFYYHFQEIQAGKTPIMLPYPGPFLIKKVAKVKCFKPIVLPHIWYIAEHGENELVKILFKSLPETEEHIQVLTPEEMKNRIFRYVLIEVKAVVERKAEYGRSAHTRITRFLSSIPCTKQADLVLYHLEDLVSPCLGLLEDQNDKNIIRNVKKFIDNLHYS